MDRPARGRQGMLTDLLRRMHEALEDGDAEVAELAHGMIGKLLSAHPRNGDTRSGASMVLLDVNAKHR